MPTSESPPIGSQSSVAPNSRSSINPSQKIGIETPKSVKVITMLSNEPPGLSEARTPTRHADERREAQSAASVSCSVTGKAVLTSVKAARLLVKRGAEIAMGRRGDEAQILDDDRLVEAELKAQLRQLLGRAAIAEQEHRHVARQHMHGEEHHDAHADEHDGELDEAPADVAQDMRSIAPRAGVETRSAQDIRRATRLNWHQALIMASTAPNRGLPIPFPAGFLDSFRDHDPACHTTAKNATMPATRPSVLERVSRTAWSSSPRHARGEAWVTGSRAATRINMHFSALCRKGGRQ